MNIKEYQTAATRTLPDLGSLELNLTHMTLGLTSEIGELVECVGTEMSLMIDRVNLIEEIGDLYWYTTNYYYLRNYYLPENPVINEVEENCLQSLIINISKLSDLVKKQIAYKKNIEEDKEKGLLYNILASIKLLENAYSLDGYKIRSNNVAKLKARYPEKFTNELALNRNIENERKQLEQ